MQSSGRIRGKISYGSLETQEGAKLVGELFTDWDTDEAAPEPPTDRLSSLVSSVASEEDGGDL